MIILPFSGELDNETFSTTLDNVLYTFNIRWNGLDEAWYMSVGLTGQPFLIRVKLTTGSNFLEPFYHIDSLPTGIFILGDNTFVDGRPLFDDIGIGKRFELAYASQEELDGL